MTPGCVEAHCHIGVDTSAMRWEGADYNEMSDAITPHMRAIDGINPIDETFGQGAELAPKNIVAVRKFEVKTPDVSIKVSPEHRDVVSTQVIGDTKYVMIRVTGPVEVNGITIEIDD